MTQNDIIKIALNSVYGVTGNKHDVMIIELVKFMVNLLSQHNVRLRGWDDESVFIEHAGNEIGYIENGKVVMYDEPR